MTHEQRSRRRVWMGLGISALVHVCLLWFLTLAPPPPVSRPADVPLEISVVTVEVPEAPDPLPEETGDASEPEPSAEPEPPVPVPASPVQPRETVSTEPELPPGEREPEVVAEEPARVAEAETPDAPAPEPASEPSTDGDASGAGAAGAVVSEAPVRSGTERPWFVPRGGPTIGSGGVPGETLSAEDQGARRAAEREAERHRVKSRVDRGIAEAIGTQRVQRGMVDPYFNQLGRALNAELETIPESLGTPDMLKQLAEGYAKQARMVGRTGAAFEDTPIGEGRDRDTLPTAAMQRDAVNNPAFASRGPIPTGGGKPPQPVMRAEIRIEQRPDGSVSSISLVKSSGNEVFDQHVLEVAPKSVAALPPPPERGSGIHDDGMRSHWAFEGHIRLDKKLKDFRIPQDLPYLVGAGALGALGGGFDLTDLGNTSVADLRDPRWRLVAKLLRVD